jgi:hypothetical protein
VQYFFLAAFSGIKRPVFNRPGWIIPDRGFFLIGKKLNGKKIAGRQVKGKKTAVFHY